MANFLRYAQVFRLYEALQPLLKYSLPVESGLPAGMALVLAPHPDDEAIGCGGAVAAHVAAGQPAAVLYCTMDTPERRAESRAAAALAGYARTLYLDHPVESLAGQAGLSRQIADALEQLRPETVLLPFALDNHVDHRALNSAFARAVQDVPRACMVYAYPVWFPLHPNVLIDISDRWDRKRQLIECYPSQLAGRDYVAMARSLGTYWATVKGRGMTVAESYFRATAASYAAFVGKVLG